MLALSPSSGHQIPFLANHLDSALELGLDIYYGQVLEAWFTNGAIEPEIDPWETESFQGAHQLGGEMLWQNFPGGCGVLEFVRQSSPAGFASGGVVYTVMQSRKRRS